MANGSLMKVESIAECSPWSILQYVWPVLSDGWFWKPIFVFFLSCRLRQVLLYKYKIVVWMEASVDPDHLYSWKGISFWKKLWCHCTYYVEYGIPIYVGDSVFLSTQILFIYT